MSEIILTVSGLEALKKVLRQVSSPIEYLTLVATFLVIVLGSYIGYQAYRGYRRNQNRPILFLGVGIFLVTAVRELTSLLAFLLVGESPLLLLLVSFGVSISGLSAVLYGFRWA